MHIDLTGRVVIVTGAARGIGHVIAEAFRAEGAVVVAVDLPSPELEEYGEVLDGAAYEADVRDAGRLRAIAADVEERFGGIDVLVNNAGVNVTGAVDEMDEDAWDRCFDINVGGVFRMSRAVISAMKRRGRGRIINAASFAAIMPSVGQAAYAASKAAVVSFTRTLAGELGPWNITVNAYAPGMIPTAMNDFEQLPVEQQQVLLDTLTLRRWGDPADVADLVRFLASDQAGYITGTLVDVSGGKLATQLPQRAHGWREPS